MSRSLITSSFVLSSTLLWKLSFLSNNRTSLFQLQPSQYGIEDELENICVTPKTNFSWSFLQIQVQMGCEKGEIQVSMNFFLLNFWFLVFVFVSSLLSYEAYFVLISVQQLISSQLSCGRKWIELTEYLAGKFPGSKWREKERTINWSFNLRQMTVSQLVTSAPFAIFQNHSKPCTHRAEQKLYVVQASSFKFFKKGLKITLFTRGWSKQQEFSKTRV